MAVLRSKVSPHITSQQLEHLRSGFLRDYALTVEKKLKELGADYYDMRLPETHRLSLVLHPDEEILGVVYGRYVHDGEGPMTIGRGVLVATDQRLFLYDTKPLFASLDEFTYDAIGGINYTHIVLMGTVILHVAGGDIKLRTFNDRCARNFVEAVEAQLSE